MLEDDSERKLAVTTLCIVAFIFSAACERPESDVCALWSDENTLQAEVFSADLRQGNLRVEKPVFNTCAVFAEHSDIPFLYSPSGECKHRI